MYGESVTLAEKSRVAASERYTELKEKARRVVARTYEAQTKRATGPVFESDVERAAGDYAKTDTVYKLAVANEQWGCRLATMYSAGIAHFDALETQRLLRDLCEKLTTPRVPKEINI